MMRDLTIAHSSDLHIDASRMTETFHPLCRVLETAAAEAADVLILAGDIFDHNRMPLSLLDRTARLLADAAMEIVILPGNHDCLTAAGVYRHGGMADPDNVHVLGVTGEAFTFPEFGLEVWGHAHAEYANMSPLARPREKTTHRQVAVAHGHWLRGPADSHRAWLITDDEISSTSADYIALGHWPQATRAGEGPAQAYYSGSPDLAGSVNIVSFTDGVAPSVRRAPLSPRTRG
jgi:DNA repair exonuclease SbcCD nuclease subunit